MKVPKHAQLVETVYATKGEETMVVRRYTGSASDGYKTDFTARPAAWIAYAITRGDAHDGWVRRWTGRNLAELDRLWPETIAALRAAGWTVDVKTVQEAAHA